MNKMKTPYHWLAISALLFIVFSCTPEAKDQCDATSAANKYINLSVKVKVLTYPLENPVDSVPVELYIDQIACGGDTVKTVSFSDSTDVNGLFETELINFVLNNTEDHIDFYGIAPGLNFHVQNFSKQVFKYNQFKGVGSEEFELIIYQEGEK